MVRASERHPSVQSSQGTGVRQISPSPAGRPGSSLVGRPIGGVGGADDCLLAAAHAGQRRPQPALVDEHGTRLAAVVAGDDAHLLHDVDEPAGAGVPDAQAPLQQRDGGGAGAHDRADGVGQVLVAAGRL